MKPAMEPFQSLPTELVHMTLTQAFTDSVCAFNSFCPMLSLCTGSHTPNGLISRFDTLTFAADGSIASVSTRIGWCADGHDHSYFPHLVARRGLTRDIDSILAQERADSHLFVFSHVFSHAGFPDADLLNRVNSMNLLRDPVAARVLPYIPNSGLFEPLPAFKETVPVSEEPLYARISNLVLNTKPKFADYDAEDFVHAPYAKAHVRHAVIERMQADFQAHLSVDFARMDRLENLFLDVRGGSFRRVVAAARNPTARKMKFGGLRMLVIYGLSENAVLQNGRDEVEPEAVRVTLASENGWNDRQFLTGLQEVQVGPPWHQAP